MPFFTDKAHYIMGIINVTPDSFSDGGDFLAAQTAIEQGLMMAEQGADILDIGGESTRPGAKEVSLQEEIDRVLPVIEGLKDCGTLLSIDTRHAAVMQAALQAGAGMINDVTALTGDPDSMKVAAAHDGPVCLMHMQGEPQSMQENPTYSDVLEDIYNYLKQRIVSCETFGIDRDRLVIDPGIGFGKTLEHNLILLNNLDRFSDLGVPVLLGASRKRFISAICGDITPKMRLPGSLATVLWGMQRGIRIFRVHDVPETAQAMSVYQAISCKA